MNFHLSWNSSGIFSDIQRLEFLKRFAEFWQTEKPSRADVLLEFEDLENLWMEDEKMEYNAILERAMKIARKRRPHASPQRHAAFANAVAYAVTGWSGGYGGPSVREHAAARVCPPYQDFDSAVRQLIAENGVVFGSITGLHQKCWVEEHCFDDDPDDVRELSRQ